MKPIQVKKLILLLLSIFIFNSCSTDTTEVKIYEDTYLTQYGYSKIFDIKNNNIISDGINPYFNFDVNINNDIFIITDNAYQYSNYRTFNLWIWYGTINDINGNNMINELFTINIYDENNNLVFTQTKKFDGSGLEFLININQSNILKSTKMKVELVCNKDFKYYNGNILFDYRISSNNILRKGIINQ